MARELRFQGADGRAERVIVTGRQVTRTFSRLLTPGDAGGVALQMFALDAGESWWQFHATDRVALVRLEMALHVTGGSWTTGTVAVRVQVGENGGLPFVTPATVPAGLTLGNTFSPPLSPGEPGLRLVQKFAALAPRNVPVPLGVTPLLRAVMDVGAGFDPTGLIAAATMTVDVDE